MIKKKIMTDYVSELDQFLSDLRENASAKSESRINEVQKHKRIAELRDIKKNIKPKETIWKEF